IRPEAFVVTADGLATLTSFGLNIGALEQSRRRFAGACLDWTERKPHLNGALGAAMTARLLGLGWIERGSRRRAVRVTPAGGEGRASGSGWSREDSRAPGDAGRSSMRMVPVNGDALTMEDVVDVARGAATAELAPDVAAVMEPSRSVVTAALEG